MLFLLLFESSIVEIDKVPGDELVRVGSSKFPLLVVFSQPCLSNKNGSVFTFDRHLHVIDLNLRESQFLPVRSGLRIGIVENHDVRFCLWHERMTVQKHRVEFGHWNDRSVWTQQRSFDAVSAFGNFLIIRREKHLPPPIPSGESI